MGRRATENASGAGSGRRPLRLLAPAGAVATALASALAAPAAAGPGGDDPGHARQWNLARVHAEEAWTAGRGEGAIVAVVDSGIDLRHEDLRDRIVGQTGCIGAGGDPRRCGGSGQDDDGHGTHVAGIAAASAGNGRGVAGVAPRASLLAVRTLHRRCQAGRCTVGGSGSDVAAGIRWATRRGAHVVNLSLGTTVTRSLGPDFDAAVEEAWAGGAVIVVAAGHALGATPLPPDSPAIVVTATTRADEPPGGTHGAGAATPLPFAMAAPGGEPGDSPSTCGTRPLGVLSTWVEGGRAAYGCLAGTSMAAAHVAGAAALLRGLGLGARETRALLLATADDLGAPGPDAAYGAGRLNVARAVAEATLARRPAARRVWLPPVSLPRPAGPAVTARATVPPPGGAGPGAARWLLPGAGAAVLAAATGAGAVRARRSHGPARPGGGRGPG